MKVAMIGSWNTDSGAAIHAELVGKELVKKGIDLKVFSFYPYSFHGTKFTTNIEEEEEYVTRCFTVSGAPHPEMNTKPILQEDFDIFVAEDLGMIPMSKLLSIFPDIRRKAKTVNIIHDGKLSDKQEFFKFRWDQVVCFDNRYYAFLKEAYPERILSIIPYPSLPLKTGNKEEARNELGLPQDKKIVLVFGPAAKHALNTTIALDRLSEKYNIMLLLVTEHLEVLNLYRKIQSRVKMEVNIVEKTPDIDLLYRYLHASDCMIYNKHTLPIVVVGSTIFQCLGAGCPIISLASNFTDSFGDEVMKYKDFYELEDTVVDVFEGGAKYQHQQKAVVDYLEKNAAGPVAEQFIELFERLLRKT